MGNVCFINFLWYSFLKDVTCIRKIIATLDLVCIVGQAKTTNEYRQVTGGLWVMSVSLIFYLVVFYRMSLVLEK